MDTIKSPFHALTSFINNSCSSKEPWQIVTITTSTVLLSVWFYNFIFDDESLLERAKKCLFKCARLIPSVREKLDTDMKKLASNFENDVIERTKAVDYLTELPKSGLTEANILNILNENLELCQYDWRKGKVSGSIYYYKSDLINLVTKVYEKTSYTNPLHSDLFPGLCKMEAEVVRIAANLFHGDENVCGTMTTGGTESILMACKAFRDYAKAVRGVKKPEIVAPTTVHAAFDKAAQYFKIKIRSVRIDPSTTQVDVKAMESAINKNTIMLVGSAPNFPYGTMDDISSISSLGVKYNIPVHVDSCLGGFLTAFMVDAGYPIPDCDFRLPGVKSISVDTHKYAFAPKGSSLILYKDRKFMHHQYTVTTDWPGGVYGSPSVNGSRAGGSIAVCWATILNFGKEGYINTTRDIIHTTKYIEKGLRRIQQIFIFGQPVTSLVAIGSNVFDIYRLGSILSENGWNLNILQFPSGIHLCVTHLHTIPGVADKFLNDVQKGVDEIMKDPGVPVQGQMALYGVSQALPDRSIVGEFACHYLDSLLYTPKKQ